MDRFIAAEGLEPGDRLPSIRDLAAQFGLKSGAVRDALIEFHLEIASLYSALVDGDVQVAKDEIRTHLQVACNTLLEELRELPATSGGNGV